MKSMPKNKFIFSKVIKVYFDKSAYFKLAKISFVEMGDVMTKNQEWRGHKLEKGVFISPFNRLQKLTINSWNNGRLSDYIWIGFILGYYGRQEGFLRLKNIFKDLKAYVYKKQLISDSDDFEPESIIEGNIKYMAFIRFSKITNFDDEIQSDIYSIFIKHIDVEVLAPLTLIFTFSKYKTFSIAFKSDICYEKRVEVLNEVVTANLDQQSWQATDIRYAILLYMIIFRKLKFCIDNMLTISYLKQYPILEHNNEIMKSARPTIRALEIGIPYKVDEKYNNYFWNQVSKLGKCKMAYIEYKAENDDADEYIKMLKQKLNYFIELYVNVQPLDIKMSVLLGLATFAYKRLLEVVEHNLYNTIAGRSTARSIIECCIIIKYLLHIEPENQNIWEDYRIYGLGQLKKLSEMYEELKIKNNSYHVDFDYVKILAEEYISKDFINIDTRYFDSAKIREKAKIVGENEIYQLVYEYDSQYEHALWGAVRESSLLACDCALHKYHSVPDIDNYQRLKSVWNDCKMYMDKIVNILEDIYGLNLAEDVNKDE